MKIFSTQRRDSVAAFGERRLISKIQRWLGNASPRSPFGIGDDCAVVPSTGRPMLITTDPVIYGQHFDDAVPARAVGAKLLKRNISDIAAMGGRPLAAVVSLALAPEVNTRWLSEFYRGLAAAARAFRVRIVGGDITQGPRGFFGAFLTLHGEAAGARAVTRHGARAGDLIYVTGELGGSRLGHHFKFTPRIEAGAWLARRPEVRAMMDLSDGLAKDLGSLTPAGLAPALCGPAIPISRAARRRARQTGEEPLTHALCDGEDYELLIVIGRETDRTALERAWRARFPRVRLTAIGVFERVTRRAAFAHAVRLQDYHGYEHLR